MDDKKPWYNETAAQLFMRARVKPVLLGLKAFDVELPHGLRAGTVVEIIGPCGTGKSELLLNALVQCILPARWLGMQLGGNECGVMYMDNDSRLDIVRLSKLLEYRLLHALQQTQTNAEVASVTECVQECLQRVNVYKCKDSAQFLATLHSLPRVLEAKTTMRVLVIDSMNAFFWLDKHEEQRVRHKRIAKQLSYLINTYNLITVATRQTLFRPSSTNNNSNNNNSNDSVLNASRDNYGSLWSDLPLYIFATDRKQYKSTNANNNNNNNNNNSNNNSKSSSSSSSSNLNSNETLYTKFSIRLVVQPVGSTTQSTKQLFKFVVRDQGAFFQ